jgi:hypothetical protein
MLLSVVGLHVKREELPEREPVVNQIGCSGYCGQSGPAVDQRDLAEVVARTEVPGGVTRPSPRGPGRQLALKAPHQ